MTIMATDLQPTLARNLRPSSPDDEVGDAWLGDWLLSFHSGDLVRLPARLPGTPWRVEREGDGWRMCQSKRAAGWRGMPLLKVETPEWSAWLAGELYGTSEPAVAIAAVLDGRSGAAALNGHFLLWASNRRTDEWHVWTNRHATLHAYLATKGTRTTVGTFLPAVAAATGCGELDWEGLVSFFGFGFFAADRTHLTGVRILRPATHYRFDAVGRLLSEERYWHWRHAPNPSRTYDETLEEFASLFAAVMDGLTANDRISVPISGGLDSRSTVATIAAGPDAGRLWAYSYGYSEDSIETGIAGRVAAARGLAFNAFTIRPYLFERLPGIMAAVEGFEDVTQCRQAAIVDEIDQRSDYVIAAHLGDLYLADMGLSDAGPGSLSDDDLVAVALKKVRKGGSTWLLESLCAPQLGATGAGSVLREMAAGELASLGDIAEPDFRIKAFKVDQWCARWTTVALRMFQAAAFPRLPFYDTRLADFFLTVPTSYLSGRRLQIDYLKRYAPDLARIPWQATGHDLFHNGRDSIRDKARRAVDKGQRRLSGRKVLERNWEVQFKGQAGRTGLARWLTRPGLTLHEFVPPRAVEELLDTFDRDPYTDKRSYTVSMLLTFSAWLELQARGGPV